jgi:hypothetical protein
MPLPTTTTSASSSDVARVLVARAPVNRPRDVALARASTRRVAARIARVDDAVAVADICLVVVAVAVVVVVASRTASSPPSSSPGDDDDVDEEKPRALVVNVYDMHTTTRPNYKTGRRRYLARGVPGGRNGES